jgi:hypothetical protein
VRHGGQSLNDVEQYKRSEKNEKTKVIPRFSILRGTPPLEKTGGATPANRGRRAEQPVEG